MDKTFKQTKEERFTMPKRWGHEDWIVNKPEYCGKCLIMNPPGATSFHYHKVKDETMLVIEGSAKIIYEYNDEILEIILNKWDSFHIPIMMKHKIIAINSTKIIEFSTQHFEDDSYRLPDPA